jgi:hypothetical protein
VFGQILETGFTNQIAQPSRRFSMGLNAVIALLDAFEARTVDQNDAQDPVAGQGRADLIQPLAD